MKKRCKFLWLKTGIFISMIRLMLNFFRLKSRECFAFSFRVCSHMKEYFGTTNFHNCQGIVVNKCVLDQCASHILLQTISNYKFCSCLLWGYFLISKSVLVQPIFINFKDLWLISVLWIQCASRIFHHEFLTWFCSCLLLGNLLGRICWYHPF